MRQLSKYTLIYSILKVNSIRSYAAKGHLQIAALIGVKPVRIMYRNLYLNSTNPSHEVVFLELLLAVIYSMGSFNKLSKMAL
jgi:hypothetical protein